MVQAFSFGVEQAFLQGGQLFIANDIALARGRQVIQVVAEDSVTSVEQTLDGGLAGAIVQEVVAVVAAQAPGTTTIGSIAQVRAASGDPSAASDGLVVDFQGLRTVSRVSAPETITDVRAWVGTQFDTRSSLVSDGASTVQEFTEVLTERLLVTFDEDVDPAELAEDGAVTVPTPPADLEVTVNGVRAWFAAGPARPNAEDAEGEAEFRTEVDITAAVQAAVAAGAVPIALALRSSVPGRLGLAARLDYLKTHAVAFPEGLARVLDAEAEGELELALPLPAAASEWSIHAVELTATATLPPVRVLPAVGPALSAEAELVLDPDRAVVVCLPTARTGLLETLTALRLPLAVGPEGGELGGTLHADADGIPGDPLGQGQLGPVPLEPGDGAALGWVSLPLAQPYALTPGETLWVALQMARGSAVWPLAVPDLAPGAVATLRRRTPNGLFRPLSTAAGVATSAGALRVAGEPPANAPVHALEARVAGTSERVGFTPTADGVTVSLRLAAPVSGADATAVVDGALRLALVTGTPGAVSFGSVRVAYTEEAGS